MVFHCPFETECVSAKCKKGIKQPAPVKANAIEDHDFLMNLSDDLEQRMAQHIWSVHNFDIYSEILKGTCKKLRPDIEDYPDYDGGKVAEALAADEDDANAKRCPGRSRSPLRRKLQAGMTSSTALAKSWSSSSEPMNTFIYRGGGSLGDNSSAGCSMVLNLGSMSTEKLEELHKCILSERSRRATALVPLSGPSYPPPQPPRGRL